MKDFTSSHRTIFILVNLPYAVYTLVVRNVQSCVAQLYDTKRSNGFDKTSRICDCYFLALDLVDHSLDMVDQDEAKVPFQLAVQVGDHS